MFASHSKTAAKQFHFLAAATAWRYWSAGRFVHGFVLGKLRHDPVYRALLAQNILPAEGLILDLGCGRGILLALLATARALGMTPGRKREVERRLYGIERRAADAEAARVALGGDAEILADDVRTTPLPPCRAVILLDVLLYLGEEAQDALLVKIANALEPGGLLIIREADAGSGWRFTATRVAERCCALARGDWRQRYAYRSAMQWRERLKSLGFAVEVQPMSEGTPFANMLFIGRLQPH